MTADIYSALPQNTITRSLALRIRIRAKTPSGPPGDRRLTCRGDEGFGFAKSLGRHWQMRRPDRATSTRQAVRNPEGRRRKRTGAYRASRRTGEPMTAAPRRPAREVRVFLDTPQGEAAAEPREAAQRAALVASAAIGEALGVAALRHRRMLAALDGADVDRMATEIGNRSFRKRMRQVVVSDDGPAARTKLRAVLGRFIHDLSESLHDNLPTALTSHLLQAGQ